MRDRWAARLSEYVDGTLDPQVVSALEAHLDSCATCRTAVGELRAVKHWLAADLLAPEDHRVVDRWMELAARLAAPSRHGRPRVTRAPAPEAPQAPPIDLSPLVSPAGGGGLAPHAPDAIPLLDTDAAEDPPPRPTTP